MHVVIIGSGHAGITAAITLRQNADDVKISMITEDNYPHYPRPSIYKIIKGKKPGKILRFPKAWYFEKEISLSLNSRVINIDGINKNVTIENGNIIPFDKLLVTTGSKSFIPPIPGLLDAPFCCLRDIEDALTIRERALNSSTGEATILGGGLLSVELAKTLSDIGIMPTIIDRSPYLLRKQLDREGGQFFNEVLDKTFQTKFLHNASCQKINTDNGHISINFKGPSGTKTHECDFLLNATGIQNENDLPHSTGINIGNYAIIVNPFMQTNIPDIYAAGDAVDIGSFPGSKFGIIPTAIDQAKIAAVNILGDEVPYTGTMPWTTLKVAGISLTSFGEVTTGPGIQEECVVIDQNKGIYRKLFFKNDILQGSILIGTKENLHTLKTLTIHRASLKEVKEEIQS
ncbi:MAG: NAD(P)/FAD-dependent oxidoreductase [Candidatus Hodarchaeales archaeon]